MSCSILLIQDLAASERRILYIAILGIYSRRVLSEMHESPFGSVLLTEKTAGNGIDRCRCII